MYLIQFGFGGMHCKAPDYETATQLFHALQKSYQWVRVSRGLEVLMEYNNK